MPTVSKTLPVFTQSTAAWLIAAEKEIDERLARENPQLAAKVEAADRRKATEAGTEMTSTGLTLTGNK